MKSDVDFLLELHNSEMAVWTVARAINKKYKIKKNPMRIRPNISVRQNYVDEGDLFVFVENWQKVEVKHRSDIEFKNRDEFPFSTVFICEDYTLNRYDNNNSMPLMWVIVNKSITFALVIRPNTRQHWTEVRWTDRKANKICNGWQCPIKYAIEWNL